jgi:histone-lysine N-methyltransferase ASH1L
MAAIMAEAVAAPLPVLSPESSYLAATPPTDIDADASSNVASLSSTPPTSVSPDNMSLSSEQGISKLINVTTPMFEEPQPLLASLALLQDDTKSPESQTQLVQQPEQTPEQDMKPTQQAQVNQLSAEEISDPDSQLQREAEAQQQADPEPASGELTPAASAIVVAPRSQPASASPSGTPQRPRRARASLPVYNISKLAGTDVHGRRRANGDDVRTKSKRRVSAADALVGNAGASSSTVDITNRVVGDAITALNLDWSLSAPATPQGAKVTKKKSGALSVVKQEISTRRTTRLSGAPVPSAVTSALTSMGKRGKQAAAEGLSRISRELKRLQDTKEFAHVDDRPIIQTVWSNGKFVDPRTLDQPAAEPRSSKRAKTSYNTEPEVEEESKPGAPAPEAAATVVAEVAQPPQQKRTTKKWLEKGLYAGQETPKDVSGGLTTAEKRRLAQFPELAKVEKVNRTLPPPMFNGLRLLLQGRDFKLPYDICNPLPPGHPKPPAYRTMTKSRFRQDTHCYHALTPVSRSFRR